MNRLIVETARKLPGLRRLVRHLRAHLKRKAQPGETRGTIERSDQPFGLMRALRGLEQRGYRPAVVLDVGAAVGAWTLEARTVWDMAHFVMVEALHERRAQLEAVAATAPGLIEVFIGGLAHVAGKLEFTVTDFLFDSSFAYGGGVARSVDTYRLDDLVAEGRIPQPDFIKLDVQGFELAVLTGGEGTLRKVSCVLMECNFFRFSESMPNLAEVVAWMNERGFLPYEFVDFLRRPLDDAMGQCDLLFVRQDHPLFADNRWVAEGSSELQLRADPRTTS